jgi:hypothetical protein
MQFQRLNTDWNAEPNAPDVKVSVAGQEVSVGFFLNPFAYDAADDERGLLTFSGCSCWRRDPTNDHGWYAEQGRFAGIAPAWGEFYEVTGDEAGRADLDWQLMGGNAAGTRHFLFYFRDEVFECWAEAFNLQRMKPA